MNGTKRWYVVAAALVAAFTWSTCSQGAPEFAVGAGQAIYTDESSNEWTFGGKLGDTRTPVYAVASYDSVRAKQLGQPMGDMDNLSFGLGASQELTEGLSAFVEFGYTWLDIDKNDHVIDEVAYTYLVGRHNVEGRRVPVPTGYGQSYGTWEVEDGIYAKLGVSFEVVDNVTVQAAYRWQYLDQELTLGPPNKHGGYWREDDTLDLSAAEVTVWYHF